MKTTVCNPISMIGLFAFVTILAPVITVGDDVSVAKAPLKVLLVAGGCCHDYAAQSKLLKEGVEQRINAVVTIEFNPKGSTDTQFKIYESDEWSEGYDVVIHDECSANVTERPYVDRILAAHRAGIPAVNLHCAMHSYRWGDFRNPVEPGTDNSGWYEMLGIQSAAHGPKMPISVTYAPSDHPITEGFDDWVTINEELYNNIRVFSQTTAIASGKQMQTPSKKDLKKNPEAKSREANAVVAWTNEYGPNKTKIFSTTLGHYNETVADDRYLELVTRGLLWTTGHLAADGMPDAAFVK